MLSDEMIFFVGDQNVTSIIERHSFRIAEKRGGVGSVRVSIDSGSPGNGRDGPIGSRRCHFANGIIIRIAYVEIARGVERQSLGKIKSCRTASSVRRARLSGASGNGRHNPIRRGG